MDKKQVAEVLEEIGTLLELKGENPFKCRAYQNAARVIETTTEPLEILIRTGRLGDLRGIGPALQEKITELVKTGQSGYLDTLRRSIPPGLLDLLRVPGLGPKKVKALNQKLCIRSSKDLEKAARENRVAQLAGFGAKTQENILAGLEFARHHQDQFLLDEAWRAGHDLADQLRRFPKTSLVCIAGSLRRHKETVKDVDLLAVHPRPLDFADFFTHLPGAQRVQAEGHTRASIRLATGMQVDLRIVKSHQLPYALLYFTGSKAHNTVLRGRAKEMGLKLNEYGLFRGKRLIRCADEKAIYRALGLAYVPPEMREDAGEIQTAERNELPVLVTEADIQGVFHVHSTESDGTASLEDMVMTAQRLGLRYVGISDHSRSAHYANGLDAERIKRQQAEIDRLQRKVKIQIFKGVESDILPDGSLDYPLSVLRTFDFVIGSIHSGFKMAEKQMTERICKALSNPYCTFLGHPTGRLLLTRVGYAVDTDAVFECAARHHKAIEINANPHRFDLDWRLHARARAKGVRFFINPDAHSMEGLSDYKFGVGIARKGGLMKRDILNTLPYEKMLTHLKVKN